jgi:hypothetical protein
MALKMDKVNAEFILRCPYGDTRLSSASGGQLHGSPAGGSYVHASPTWDERPLLPHWARY